jgi:ATP-dependent Zn protease
MDLKRARELATRMVYDYGMGNSILSNEGEIGAILEEAYQEVRGIVNTNRDLIEKCYHHLLEREVIHPADIRHYRENVF